MNKLYYNNDGWVCGRYPYNLEVKNESLFLEVDDETFNKTLCSTERNAWRVFEGKISLEEYAPETTEQRLTRLRRKRHIEFSEYSNRNYHGTLTTEQEAEYTKWYKDWLDVTETLKEPTRPEWLK